MTKIEPVNWVIEDKDGAQKVYHRNLIKLASSRTDPEFNIQHKPYVLADKGASDIIQLRVNIPKPSDPVANEIQHSQTLTSSWTDRVSVRVGWVWYLLTIAM